VLTAISDHAFQQCGYWPVTLQLPRHGRGHTFWGCGRSEDDVVLTWRGRLVFARSLEVLSDIQLDGQIPMAHELLQPRARLRECEANPTPTLYPRFNLTWATKVVGQRQSSWRRTTAGTLLDDINMTWDISRSLHLDAEASLFLRGQPLGQVADFLMGAPTPVPGGRQRRRMFAGVLRRVEERILLVG